MAKVDTFRVTVVTPERAVLDADALFAAFPAHDGEMGMLPGRAPLVCKLGIGVLRIDGKDQKHQFLIDGGFAQIVDNRLTILTEQAKKAQDIQVEQADKAMTEALAMRIKDEASSVARGKALRRAQVQKKLARRG